MSLLDVTPWYQCYHPYSRRYLVFPGVEQCGYCAACRVASDEWWPPLTRPLHYEWADVC